MTQPAYGNHGVTGSSGGQYSHKSPVEPPDDWDLDGIDESRIHSLALEIVAAEGIPLRFATERAAIMLYGSDVRAFPALPGEDADSDEA